MQQPKITPSYLPRLVRMSSSTWVVAWLGSVVHGPTSYSTAKATRRKLIKWVQRIPMTGTFHYDGWTQAFGQFIGAALVGGAGFDYPWDVTGY